MGGCGDAWCDGRGPCGRSSGPVRPAPYTRGVYETNCTSLEPAQATRRLQRNHHALHSNHPQIRCPDPRARPRGRTAHHRSRHSDDRARLRRAVVLTLGARQPSRRAHRVREAHRRPHQRRDRDPVPGPLLEVRVADPDRGQARRRGLLHGRARSARCPHRAELRARASRGRKLQDERLWRLRRWQHCRRHRRWLQRRRGWRRRGHQHLRRRQRRSLRLHHDRRRSLARRARTGGDRLVRGQRLRPQRRRRQGARALPRRRPQPARLQAHQVRAAERRRDPPGHPDLRRSDPDDPDPAHRSRRRARHGRAGVGRRGGARRARELQVPDPQPGADQLVLPLRQLSRRRDAGGRRSRWAGLHHRARGSRPVGRRCLLSERRGARAHRAREHGLRRRPRRDPRGQRLLSLLGGLARRGRGRGRAASRPQPRRVRGQPRGPSRARADRHQALLRSAARKGDRPDGRDAEAAQLAALPHAPVHDHERGGDDHRPGLHLQLGPARAQQPARRQAVHRLQPQRRGVRSALAHRAPAGRRGARRGPDLAARRHHDAREPRHRAALERRPRHAADRQREADRGGDRRDDAGQASSPPHAGYRRRLRRACSWP